MHALRQNRYAVLWTIAFAGLVLHLAGLGWDIAMHNADSSLAEREGIVTLANPSHVLIFAGIGLLAAGVIGVGLLKIGELGRGARFASFAMIPVLALASTGAVALAFVSRDSTHDHATTADHPHAETAALPGQDAVERLATAGHDHPATTAPGTSTDSMSSENAHFHGHEVAVTEEDMRAALALVDAVKAETARFEDIRVAMKEGYVQLTQDLPGIAAHFARLDYLADDAELDPARPEILLYTKRLDGTWRFVGVMFQAGVTPEPPSYFGGLDVWHYHENLCFTVASVRVVKGAAECRNGQYLARTGWEMHVWTQPGASGPFAHDYAPIAPGKFPGASRPAALELAAARVP